MMTPERLAGIKARANDATPGPWERHYDGIIRRIDGLDNWICEGPSGSIPQIAADMDFIAHARTDIPDLINEIERLTTALRQAQDEIDQLHKGLEVLSKFGEELGGE